MLGVLDKAWKMIEKLDKNSIAANYWLGEIHRSKGMFNSSKLHFERAITGTRNLEVRECNGDTMIRNSKERLKELEALCVHA